MSLIRNHCHVVRLMLRGMVCGRCYCESVMMTDENDVCYQFPSMSPSASLRTSQESFVVKPQKKGKVGKIYDPRNESIYVY